MKYLFLRGKINPNLLHTHQKYIRRCIELAKKGLGRTYPNPMVGSVVVFNGKIIGEGWHQKAGDAHAEVNAINSVSDKSLLKKSVIYVGLEPCSHFGKTPPCADLIIAHKIPEVVVGCTDPNEKVAGQGIKKLLEAGCKVTVGVLEDECIRLNKRFFTFHQKKRPYIILKWAQTQEGFIAPEKQKTGKPFWITNAHSTQLVHKWRCEEQSILVGTATALKDNPQLNVRLWKGSNPVRVVIDKDLKISKDYFLMDGTTSTIVITQSEKTANEEKIIFEPIDFTKNTVGQICEILYKHNLQSVIVEGGAKTLQAFINAGLWDEARVFTGEKNLKSGIKAPDIRAERCEETTILSDKLMIYYND